MNGYQSMEQTLTAFFDTLPWPVLVVDAEGLITFANHASSALLDEHNVIAGKPLRHALPAYFGTLQGEVPWLAPQETVVERRVDGVQVSERIVMRPLMRGACLFVMRMQDAEAGVGDAQLARLASIGFMVAGV